MVRDIYIAGAEAPECTTIKHATPAKYDVSAFVHQVIFNQSDRDTWLVSEWCVAS